jgi:hypothetical protein
MEGKPLTILDAGMRMTALSDQLLSDYDITCTVRYSTFASALVRGAGD